MILNTRIDEMALVAAAVVFWMWLRVHMFDRKYGHTDDRPPSE